jgi:hypothetical protein
MSTDGSAVEYASGNGIVVMVHGEPIAVQDVSYAGVATRDEITNLVERGYSAVVRTTKRTTATVIAVYDSNNPPTFQEGDTIPMVISVPNGPGVTGDFYVMSMTWPKLVTTNPILFTFEVESTGKYINSGVGGGTT